MAGYVQLEAQTIDASAGATIISASQTPGSDPGSDHNVIIAAASIKFGTGLTMKADGDGVSSSVTGGVYIVPQNSTYVTDTQDPANLQILFFFNGTPGTYTGALAFTNGTGPLTISANGSNVLAEATGYPLSFTGTDVTIRAQGKTNHKVYVGYFNGGGTTLTFSNSGKVLLDASATASGTGGDINLTSYNAVITAPTMLHYERQWTD